ncbi:hypothetical protein D5F01_LYC09834 [Larimichthys crocea]|uniref:Dynein regulatory complex subunit 2 n=1 Tax=Larimichthys crocea TaxID=215358 RepID=A0A6G0IM67_LARCR|nr:hypothetical protein D5F01_LYC09834 [Larimichthys crocea]
MPKKSKKEKGGSPNPQEEEGMAAKNVHSRTLSLQAKLEAEKRNSAATMLKVNEGWRSILRQTQDTELRQHIMMLKQQFERETDGLDNTIENLECGLLQKERQSAQVRRAHLQNVESLCALQDKRLNLVQEPWENCMEHISSKLNSQSLSGVIWALCFRELLLADSQQQEDNLEATMSLMEDKHKAVMEDMHKLYSQSTKLYEYAYEERKEADTEKKEESKQKPKWEPENDEWFRRMMEKDTFDIQEVNKDIKKMMTGERILLLGKVCQTLETKLEKASAISFPTMEHREEKTEPETEEPAKKVSEVPELHQLTQRLNHVVLQRDALKKHKVELKQENEQLKLQLHKHLDDMTLSNNTFSTPDAPLTVHQALITRAPKTNTPNTNTPTPVAQTPGPQLPYPKHQGPNTRPPKTNTPTTTKM